MDASHVLYERHPLTQPRDIRILHVIASKQFASPLQAHMEVIQLSDHGSEPVKPWEVPEETFSQRDPYQALSYAWGSLEKSQVVHVDGVPVPITANLHSALLRIRERVTAGELPSLPMWIDAICINQARHLERQHQVMMMADIYRHATQLIIWLGECSQQDGRELRTGADPRVPPHMATDSNEGMTSRISTVQPEPLTWEPSHSRKVALWHKLLSSPWFRRRWIVQEALLTSPSNRFVLYGTTVQRLHEISLELQRYASNETRSIAPFLLEPVIRWGEGLVPKVLLHNLLVFRDSECYDPHDRIYALLGISCDVGTIDIDYEERIEDLYRRLAVIWLGRNVVHVLACATVTRASAEEATPSWLPVWHSVVEPISDEHRQAIDASSTVPFPSLDHARHTDGQTSSYDSSFAGKYLESRIFAATESVGQPSIHAVHRRPDQFSSGATRSSGTTSSMLVTELHIRGWLFKPCSHPRSSVKAPFQGQEACSCTFQQALDNANIPRSNLSKALYVKNGKNEEYWEDRHRQEWTEEAICHWPQIDAEKRVLWFRGSHLGFVLSQADGASSEQYVLESCFRIFPPAFYQLGNFWKASPIDAAGEVARELEKLSSHRMVTIV